MQDFLQAFATLMALVNPAMCGTIFLNEFSRLASKERAQHAFKAVCIICIVLMLSAVFGARILATFGVSLSAFSFAGGFILAVIGIKMLNQGDTTSKKTDDEQSNEINLKPLVLFAASPGTITGIITISSSNSGAYLPSLMAVTTVSIILLAILLVISFSPAKSEKPSITRQMITSYFGVIVIAMGVQFAFTGFKAFMYGG